MGAGDKQRESAKSCFDDASSSKSTSVNVASQKKGPQTYSKVDVLPGTSNFDRHATGTVNQVLQNFGDYLTL